MSQEEFFKLYLHKLRNKYQINNLLVLFVVVQNVYYFQAHNIGIQSFEISLRLVTQMFVLDGHPNLKRYGNQQELDLIISKIIEYYCNKDPAHQPKNFIPVTIIHSLTHIYQFISQYFKSGEDLTTLRSEERRIV